MDTPQLHEPTLDDDSMSGTFDTNLGADLGNELDVPVAANPDVQSAPLSPMEAGFGPLTDVMNQTHNNVDSVMTENNDAANNNDSFKLAAA